MARAPSAHTQSRFLEMMAEATDDQLVRVSYAMIGELMRRADALRLELRKPLRPRKRGRIKVEA